MTKSEPIHVFVYGTLRPILATGEPRLLVEGLRNDGPAIVQGQLFDLGDYPGLVVGPGTVHGDLLVVDTVDQLVALDAYEECGPPNPLFIRERTTAQRTDGSRVAVWVYRYRLAVTDSKIIAGGDYARHMQRNSSYSSWLQ